MDMHNLFSDYTAASYSCLSLLRPKGLDFLRQKHSLVCGVPQLTLLDDASQPR